VWPVNARKDPQEVTQAHRAAAAAPLPDFLFLWELIPLLIFIWI
jgi:hypothetical protein